MIFFCYIKESLFSDVIKEPCLKAILVYDAYAIDIERVDEAAQNTRQKVTN